MFSTIYRGVQKVVDSVARIGDWNSEPSLEDGTSTQDAQQSQAGPGVDEKAAKSPAGMQASSGALGKSRGRQKKERRSEKRREANKALVELSPASMRLKRARVEENVMKGMKREAQRERKRVRAEKRERLMEFEW